MEFSDKRRGPFLVPPHHAAEAGDVDHEDGRELTTRCGSFCRHGKTIMPSASACLTLGFNSMTPGMADCPRLPWMKTDVLCRSRCSEDNLSRHIPLDGSQLED